MTIYPQPWRYTRFDRICDRQCRILVSLLPKPFHKITIKYFEIMKLQNRVPLLGAACALVCLYCLAGVMFAHAIQNPPEPLYDSPEYEETLYADIAREESGGPVDGMFFSSEYVVECCEYDDAYAIVYDDPDANIVECEILVSETTYSQIMHAQADDVPVHGSLYELPDGDAWGFVWDGCME